MRLAFNILEGNFSVLGDLTLLRLQRGILLSNFLGFPLISSAGAGGLARGVTLGSSRLDHSQIGPELLENGIEVKFAH